MTLKNIELTLPNKDVLSFVQGITGTDLIQDANFKSSEEVIVLEVNGQLYDLSMPITEDASVRLLTWTDPAGKKIFWQSTAHLLGMALHILYPDAQLGLSKTIAKGFYYDVDFGKIAFGATHLAGIEKKMYDLARLKTVYKQVAMTKKEALAHYETRHNPYKLEVIQAMKQASINFYQQDGYIDVAQEPLLPHTGCIKAIKLLHIAGAYWQADAKNKQLTRIYGISFPQKTALKEHLDLLEKAKKRDHRKIGIDLGFFAFSQQLGLGLPLWLPKGAFLREQLIQKLGDKLKNDGYQFIATPHIAHKNLYITSGHYEKYSEDTFQPITTPQEDETFLIKPMNCPHHCLVYQSSIRSYKDLPVRLAEFGTVYRYEQHGELHGLIRTRCFTQDDGHIFCTPEQIKDELATSIKLILEVFELFGFKKYHAQISVRDLAKASSYIGDTADWELAEKALAEAATLCGLTTTTLQGEAAFYGPKIDFMIEDALERDWQLGTVQLDYQLPQRFDLNYITSTNTKARPVMIHRAALGSLERFIGILLEHTAGKLPLWLCLEQVAILPITEKYISYAHQVATTLQEHDIRTTIDERNEKITRKIRDAEASKIPYMLIVGEKEASQQKVALRTQGKGMQGTFSVQAFIQKLTQPTPTSL